MIKEQRVLSLLEQLPARMQELGLWQQECPAIDVLQSIEPFSMDKLKPEEWLQWVFSPRILDMIDKKKPLPQGFSIAPYFEECWKDKAEVTVILGLLKAIDEACA
ncbi:YqcC family protein [Vibrio ostreicida]|uniref:YqcC family protein n=1 Tax=Vibrio ostreicida TaxID=526588 RepID=A0ABT8BU59_9VIBR|nr:YqcC family protein [Vibrio ostreicida]MDN3610706.1 YqcC family protein [Vibrio ostreicida]NPD07296.1 YqcC family protein [Vibrio ostreicida]